MSRSTSSEQPRPAVVSMAVSLALVVSLVIALTDGPWQILCLCALTCGTELLPVSLWSQSTTRETEITVSTSFGLAAAAIAGPVVGAASLVAAVTIAAVIGRHRWWKPLVNSVMYAVSAIGFSVTMSALTGTWTISADGLTFEEVAVVTVSATVFLLINLAVMAALMSLVDHAPVATILREGVRGQFLSNTLIVALIPIVMLVVTNGPSLTPLLILPVVVARHSVKIAEESDRRALRDPLTGLFNRVYLRSRLGRWVDAGQTGHLALLGIDRFKEVNDVLGVLAGDHLVQLVATRLSSLESLDNTGVDRLPECSVTRDIGDNFAILTSSADAHALVRRVNAIFAVPFEIEGRRIELQVSIGIATLAGGDPDMLLRRAELAMFEAKRRPERVVVHTERLERGDPDRISLLAELRLAMVRGDLEIALQPVVSLTTGQAFGFEVLARWHHSTRGAISPAVFIPIAEQSGLIGELTEYILDRALAACRRLHDAGWTASMSVNVSQRTLHDSGLAERIARLLDRYRLSGDALIIEVTESTFMIDPQRSIAALQLLADQGVGVALDDYGTGYSSLSMLSLLPLQVLKIDQSFVTDMTPGSRKELITSSTVDMAHRLGFRVVAEGIETPEVWEMLGEMGCDGAQGYFIRRPGSLAEIITWLIARDAQAARDTSKGHPRSGR